MDQNKLRDFIQMHVETTVKTIKNEHSFFWEEWKKQLKPLRNLNTVMGLDNTELDRASKALEDAQLNLRSVRDECVVRLERSVSSAKFEEDLT